MKLKDFFAFKDWLSYRQKVGLLVIAGVVCGLGGLFIPTLTPLVKSSENFEVF